MTRFKLYQIPVCPFCQRLEILLDLKGARDAASFEVIDITVPRPDWLLKKTRGTTALPVLETEDGRILKESLVLMQYLDDMLPAQRIARSDPYERAIEGMLTRLDSDFTTAGYTFVMNQDPTRTASLRDKTLHQYARLDAFLREHAPTGPYLFDDFGWAEAVFTPFFQRFWFLEYYEDFKLPEDGRFDRVKAWIDACLAHPAAQQTSREEIVKVYYDYAKGGGGGSPLPGRTVSSFALEPSWRSRPWPPRNKYADNATDAELGLLGSRVGIASLIGT